MKVRLIGIVCLVACALTLTAAIFADPRSNATLEDRAELVIRKIGHDLLLHAGDSTSRVLPIKKLGSSSYQISFESKFSFMPDSLAGIVHRSIVSIPLPTNYLVRVFDCRTDELVYGYEISSPYGGAQACTGRVQPLGCYTVQISFLESIEPEQSYAGYYYGLFTCIGITLLFIVWPKRAVKSASTEIVSPERISVGAFTWDPVNGSLQHNSVPIPLSNKELKLLSVLIAKRNEVVDRDYLQNEVWGSEGVITGRSLDMFISKLRKKLQDDPTIRIVNIHGRGYKLEIS